MKYQIKKIYAEELNHPDLSEKDDFYDVGGHSLIMTKIRTDYFLNLILISQWIAFLGI